MWFWVRGVVLGHLLTNHPEIFKLTPEVIFFALYENFKIYGIFLQSECITKFSPDPLKNYGILMLL